MTRAIIIILALSSFCLAKDSVSVNLPTEQQGIFTVKRIAYDADKILQSVNISSTGIVSVVIAPEIYPYIIRDTTKMMLPFIGTPFNWSRNELGGDTVLIDTLTKHTKARVRAKISVTATIK